VELALGGRGRECAGGVKIELAVYAKLAWVETSCRGGDPSARMASCGVAVRGLLQGTLRGVVPGLKPNQRRQGLETTPSQRGPECACRVKPAWTGVRGWGQVVSRLEVAFGG
jgi:hypothetical protein